MPLTPSETRQILDRLGHRPRRPLGQNFLIDGNIVRKSLELARVAPGDRVVEIGPGLGTLTSALLDAGARVWAVELDDRLHAHLASTLVPASGGRLALMHGDAVEHPLAGLQPNGLPRRSPSGEGGDPDPGSPGFKIVANLPYSISTPWLDAVLAGPLPERMVLMVQRDASDRFIASHGSKNFGAIPIFLRLAFDAAPGHTVSAACFYPRPDVESHLLHLVRKPAPVTLAPEVRAKIRTLFQQRRKQIGALLRRHAPCAAAAWMPALAAAGLDETARPEGIPLSAWQQFPTRLV
jgi:16S rRNA (adenine1518-N6/adenine1519-N6)-dimethyltransferase